MKKSNERCNFDNTMSEHKNEPSIRVENHVIEGEISTYSVVKDQSERSHWASSNQSYCSINELEIDLSLKNSLLAKESQKTEPNKHEYSCKGDLSSYIKKYEVPTITHEYLSEKKINIVKIDVVKESTKDSLKNGNESMAPNSIIEMPKICDINNVQVPKAVTGKGDINFKNKKLTALCKQDLNYNIDQRNMEIDKIEIKSSIAKQKYFFPPTTIQSPATKVNEKKKSDFINEKTDNQSYSIKYFKRSPYLSPGVTTMQNYVSCKKGSKIEEINKEDSLDISGLLSTSESTVHKSISVMSGIEDLPYNMSGCFPRPKEISGIGG